MGSRPEEPQMRLPHLIRCAHQQPRQHVDNDSEDRGRKDDVADSLYSSNGTSKNRWS
jgi:hypothetical protein